MNKKNEVLYRVYFLLFGIILPVAFILLYRTIKIAVVEGDRWREYGKDLYMEIRPVEAERGNILAADGSLLATSIPYFDIYMDPNSTGMSEEDFMENIDSLAQCIATQVDQTYTPGGFREYLLDRRAAGDRYVLIKKRVSYAEKKKIEGFPLFNLGQMRGGFIARKSSERKRPFGILAQRTIGYIREGAKPVGLEGYFDEVLGGHPGQELMVRVDKGKDIWVPVNNLSDVEPQSGDDIRTTIDVNLQGITEEALMRAMNHHNAEWGAAVLMEVKTGAIRAVSNLGRTGDGWWETYNHAVGSATEPGSTFKLASIMALLEDGYVSLDDSIAIDSGRVAFYDEAMEDSSPASFSIDSTTVRQAFEMSSNVGMAKMVDHFYSQKKKVNNNEGAARFIRHLKEFNLHLPTGIEIEGEANPYVKEAYSEEDQWSGITLPWMSTGYEVRLTPVQLLSFYNAVANDGTIMKPYLVSAIQRYGETVETFRPTVVKRRIASEKTIAAAKELLEGVVERGTAEKLKSDDYRFAGKTGTAQINYRRSGSGRRIGGYQASFAGYFPVEDPVYSCIVVIRNPRQNGIYGADVAGPVFREIADRCFASRVELHEPVNRKVKPLLAANELPSYDVGKKDDIEQVLRYLGLAYYGHPETDMGVLMARSDSLSLERRTMPEKVVPSVIGMGLRDALFVLENRGLKVDVKGYGKVKQQSIRAGTQARGQTIRLTLG